MKKQKLSSNTIKLKNVEEEIQHYILKNHPELTVESEIPFSMLLNYRLAFIKQIIASDSERIQRLNEEVLQTIENHEIISDKIDKSKEKELNFGQKAADAIAKFGGSWPFILLFVFVLITWIVLNSTQLLGHPFDPYPYILLNLALSCLAALQAPIIMMSQNRQAYRDRMEASNDYKVNLKAEIEISLLHEKIDYLLNSQWEHLNEMQNIQIELLGELQEQLNELKK